MNFLSRSTFIVACLLISAALGALIVRPVYVEWARLEQQIKIKGAEIRSQQDYYASLEQAASDLKNYAVSLEKVDAGLPSKPDLPALFDYFQKAASENGLVLKSIGVPAVSDAENFSGKKIGFLMSLSGSYPSFKNLLASLQKSARLVEVETVAFSAPSKGDVFDFNISLQAYSY